jgi:DNA-binding NarL/FixJ family response regulator
MRRSARAWWRRWPNWPTSVQQRKSAIDWLCNPSNEWDIAIVDLTLERGGSGFGVLSAIRNRKPGRKVVVLTGSANPDVRKQCEALGSDGVFDKSIETDALIEYCQALPGPSGAG